MVDPVKNAYLAPVGSLLGEKAASGAGPGNETFSALLKESINEVSGMQHEADKAIEGLAKGEVKNIHETMIAIEKANISFNLMVQVRNKLLAAYEEVMRMQV